ncbi:discoidin domain-containing protein [Rhodopila sp.]|uniref:discoidin domain-containing protein n=1 Tax=Rhodopila sp. TaxID=2480087 RepID=UPI002C30B086|nr:discoidin domain-containing protein [Rhodopila sp.]HVZ09480.1 discoidin domain-containing protein [Rhodopila sp.]
MGRLAALQDWIAYHRAIGISHIYLYATDPDPTELADVLIPHLYGQAPFVTLLHCPNADRRTIHLHAVERFRQETDWFCALGVEEFLVLRQLDDLYAFMLDHRHRCDGLCFHTVPYGAAHLPRHTVAPMLMTHLWRAAAPMASTRMLWRADAVTPDQARDAAGPFWQAPDALGAAGLRCHDVLFQDMAGYSADSDRFIRRPGFAQAVLDRAYVADLRRPDPLAPAPAVYDPYLAGFWHRYTASAADIAILPDQPPSAHGNAAPGSVAPGNAAAIGDTAPGNGAFGNVALGKPSWQSSIFHPGQTEPIGSRSFGGGNNGLRPRSYGFHTTREPGPWWIVDLLAPHEIAEIRIHNRGDNPDVAGRASALEVRISVDGAAWHGLFSQPDRPFGLDHQPLRIVPDAPALARFVMVRLREAGILHLEEVEVYGTPSSAATPLVGTALTREALSPA